MNIGLFLIKNTPKLKLKREIREYVPLVGSIAIIDGSGI
jgi:hypothetical protein